MQKLFQMRALSCLLLLAAAQTIAFADEDKSLVESALDLPGTDVPSPIPSPASSVKKATSSSDSFRMMESSSASPKPARSTKTASADPADPDNIKLQAPPIHYILPYSESKIFGTKYGKAHSIDPTYRGTPSLPVTLPTVTVGNTHWAPPKKQIATAPVAAPPATKAPVLVPTVEKNGVEMEKREGTPQFSTVNVRFLTIQNFKPTDVVYAYPYPVKPPKSATLDPLPETERALKDMIMISGYSSRIDLSRPYPQGGIRWVRAFETALKKSGTHMPHTMLTVYPWINKMYPYVLSEVRQINLIEVDRKEKYLKVVSDYERMNGEMESKAVSEGLVPIPVKVNARGIGTANLPAGAWWLTATRRLAGAKFYWQVPIRCSSGDAINVQFTEANALLIQGSW